MKPHVLSCLFVLTVLVTGCSIENLERQGVKAYNNIDEISLSHIQKAGMLDDGESALVYYDTTLSLDGSESYLLTDKRVLHQKSGKINAMKLSKIQDIKHETLSLEGDRITVSDGKTKLIMTIAHMNDGDVFLKELRDKVASFKK